MNSPLKWDVFVSSQIPAVTRDLPPGVTDMKWSPISSTLISGERDAVLVDTFITVEQNRVLAECVAASGKNLTTIYATHGHGDHFFGVNTIQLRFPNARFVASRDAISVMRRQLSPAVLEAFWKSRFPGQIDATLPIAEDLAGGVIQLEGEELVSIPTGLIPTVRLASMCLRSAWSWQATLRITMFMSTSPSRPAIRGRSGSLRST
jgi:glyoxylase-like metal-dependent hydrolase (beta-lactamase superfamily II)